MYEADELCQRIAVIAGGEFVAAGTPAELKARVADRTVIEIETFGVDEAMLDRLRAVDGVASVATETRDQAELVLVQSRRRRRSSCRRCCASSTASPSAG